MAEEKKPKIDLKARLGKTAMGQTPPPAGAGAVPPPQQQQPGMPMATPGTAMPAPGAPVGSPTSNRMQNPGAPTPAPAPVMQVGVPVGPPTFRGPSRPPPGLDASNPLAAAVQPYRAPAPAPAPLVQHTRIEVDEMGVQQAAKSGRRQGIVAGLVFAVVFAVVGYLGGGATEQSTQRKKSIDDAQALSKDVGAAKDKLKDMADKLDAGRNALIRDKKFPDTLAKDLGGINVDFGGDKLAFRRFSGFSTDATGGLVEFISAVQSVNDRKMAIISLLSKLQKPITEQFKAAGQTNIQQVVLLGRQDEARNNYAVIATLKDPLSVQPPNINLPNEFTFIDPQSKQPAKLAKYTTGDLTKPAALYIPPKAFEAVCPSDISSQALQLGGQIKHIIDDIRGETAGQPVDPNIVQDSKPGLLDRADKLIANLDKVGK